MAYRRISFDRIEQMMTFDFNDDDYMDIDIRSSIGSSNTRLDTYELDNASSKKISSIFTTNVGSIDGINNKTSTYDILPIKTGGHMGKIMPRAVYDYATLFQQALDVPYLNRLDQDVAAVHGSKDPPAGFGFLHPRFRYLHQKRPIPLKPLPVWRGYNGNVYFSPIQVQQLEGDRPFSHTKSFKSASTQSIPSTKKIGSEESNSTLSSSKNKKSITHKNENQQKTSKNGKVKTKTHAMDIFPDDEDNSYEPRKMWQSTFANSHSRIKRIPKQSQHTIEDLQKEQALQNLITHNRQILPNIRLIPKTKFLHKGLAYKESQRLPMIVNGKNDEKNLMDNTSTVYEHKPVRIKHKHQQLPPITMATSIIKDQSSHVPTIIDLHEIRKRIIKGPTRTPAQSTVWTSSQDDHGSTISSQLVLPGQTFNQMSLSFVSTSYQSKHKTSNIPQIPLTKNNVKIRS